MLFFLYIMMLMIAGAMSGCFCLLSGVAMLTG